MKINVFLLISILFFAPKIISAQKKLIRFNNPNIQYEGRIAFSDSAACVNWSGSSISLNFKGSEISAILKDADTSNYYNVILDEKVISKIQLDTIKKSYVLASNLSNGTHKIQLFKRTEWGKGQTFFYGFETNENATILPKSKPKKKKIEFYGDSITCGYGNEVINGKDSGTGHFENNYLTYGAITARHFDAQFSCIANSGIGITVSWFPTTMPDIYDLTDPHDINTKWNFNNYTPDVVVINLFQNDSWLVNKPTHEEFKRKFGSQKPNEDFIIKSYENFVKSIRQKYPNTTIICALGNMDATKEGSKWPNYIVKALENLQDKKIYSHFFTYKNTPGHPKVNEQKAMADSLIAFINQNIKW
ncbi:SGNH/GDSL hydrolase family protein [Flavobacterium sp.]|uniref:SGNH/GDSL hydrolase family protein n=1 Tax=Flavobacterium sp. TaxID=239 RepID=UPI00286EA3E1|nr:SGNH/GDSL hydrolase family protein [Flavobacterium sp.]